MTTIYLIRHAEAEGNLYRRIHGQYDSLVTVRGKKQIARLAERFKDIRVDHVYSSDLTRTKVTAGAVLTGRNIELKLLRGLREVHMGAWEDKTWGEVERFEPEQMSFFNNDPSQWTVEGSEHFDKLQKRITNTVLDIASRHNGETVAAVSHGSALRSLMCHISGVPPTDIARVKHFDNTAVTLLHIDGDKIDVEYAGDNSHLTEELSTFAHQKWWRENMTFDSTNLRFTPFDLENYAGLYLEYRRDAWMNLYGENPAEAYETEWLSKARQHAAAHPRAVSLAILCDTPTGAVELDTESGVDEKAGVIEFFYMTTEQRHTGIAVQLLGQATSVYRSLGREKLRMAVSEKNEMTVGFCNRYGFVQTGETVRHGDRHIVFEMNIKVDNET